jgi:class 3 adenylate cyclase
VTMCPVCSAQVARKHRYCPQCGGSLDGAADKPSLLLPAGASARDERPIQRQHRPKLRAVRMSTENKQVSVLFVDVCDSTSLLQHADPEESRDYLGKALDLLVDAVETFGGTISQLLGDGLVALFGAPLAQEDHALRACMAALKMQRATIPEYEARGLASPTFRIGINSGEVLVGIVGQYQWSHYGADGQTIHIASRLEKMAPPRGILLSASTQRLVVQQIDTRPVGVRSVRGLTAPIELHEVLVGTESSAAAPLTRKQRWAPLIGREDSLQVLGRAIETVQTGTMRLPSNSTRAQANRV